MRTSCSRVDEVQLNQDIVAGTTIATTAYISTATAAQLSAAGTNYPAWTRQYTVMLDDVSQGVEAIHSLALQWTKGVPADPYDEAVAIEQHLRDPALFQYTLNPPQDRPQHLARRVLPDHEPQGLLPVLRVGDGIDAAQPQDPDPAGGWIRSRNSAGAERARRPAPGRGDHE